MFQKLARLTLMLLAAALPAAALAQDAPRTGAPAPTGLEQQGVFNAPVIVDGKALFEVRGSSALPATKRALEIAGRIIAVAEASEGETVDTTFISGDIGIEIQADGSMITFVTQADAELEQLDMIALAAVQGNAISKAILDYRYARTSEARISAMIRVALWTAAFVLFTIALFWLRRRLKIRITKEVHQRFAQVETATNAQVQAEAVAALIRFGANFVLLVIFFLGIYYYLSFILLAFAETRYVAQILLTYVTKPVLNIVTGFFAYLPNLITLVIIALVTQYVIRGLRVLLEAVEAGNFDLGDFERHWISPTFNILRAAIILIALVFAFPYIPGSDSAAFQGLTILVGAMLSLGANSVVSNLLAGLFVIYRRSTSIGDRIKVGEHVGDVIQIKMMETHLRSIKNELISIPNALLLNSEVVNYSKQIDGQGMLLHTTVGIGYEETPAKIEAMLIEAARRTKGLKKTPHPFVLWANLADYAINYQINAYTTKDAQFPAIRSDLNKNIVAVFNENKVQIMTPSYIADTPEPKIAVNAWDGQLAKPD